jgi:predicted transcriptional regulator
MKKNKSFIVRMSDKDLQELDAVAQVTQRSKSAVLRWAIHEAAINLQEQPEKTKLLDKAKLN